MKELWYGDVRVKKYKSKATQQWKLTRVFENDGWPRRIDSPLGADSPADKKILRDTIYALNDGLDNKALIRFESDGEGLGIRWQRL